MMLSRLRYLLAEGFEVSMISGYDAPRADGNPGMARITYVLLDERGRRRLCSEEFEVGRDEVEECSKVFLGLR